MESYLKNQALPISNSMQTISSDPLVSCAGGCAKVFRNFKDRYHPCINNILTSNSLCFGFYCWFFFSTGFSTQFLTALHLTGMFLLFISRSKCKLGMLTFSPVCVHEDIRPSNQAEVEMAPYFSGKQLPMVLFFDRLHHHSKKSRRGRPRHLDKEWPWLDSMEETFLHHQLILTLLWRESQTAATKLSCSICYWKNKWDSKNFLWLVMIKAPAMLI